MLYKVYDNNRLIKSYEQAIETANKTSNISLDKAKKIPLDKPVKILILEGEGLYGIISTKILIYLEQKTRKSISSLFDIIAGVSIGSLQTALLTTPDKNGKSKYSSNDLLNLFNNYAGKALTPTFTRKILSAFGLYSPLIDTQSYKQLLYKYFNKTQFSELNNNVFLTGYDMYSGNAKFFSNKADIDNSNNFLLYQLICGITSIPGIMPPQNLSSISSDNKYLLADPTFVINNPTLASLIYANQLYPKHKKDVIFIGLGNPDLQFSHKQHNYYSGIINTINNYLYMIWGSRDNLLGAYIKKMAEYNYLGLSSTSNFYLNQGITLNDLGSPIDASRENLLKLNKQGDIFVEKNKKELDKLSKLLLS